MILIGAGFLILIFGTIFIGEQAVELSRTKEQVTVKDIAYSIQKELYFAASAGHGFQRTIFIPEQVSGFSFIIQNTDKELIIQSQNYDFGFIIPKTEGVLLHGKNTIANNQERVCINGVC